MTINLLTISMFALSKTSLKLLRQAGWFEGRHIDIAKSEKLLRKEGYHVSPAVKTFLQEFGELRFIDTKVQPPAPRDWHFCVREAVSHIYAERVLEDYNPRAGHQLCVIGGAAQGYLTLMMDEIGQVYGGYDQELYCYGKSGREAIQRLCEGQGRLKRIPE